VTDPSTEPPRTFAAGDSPDADVEIIVPKPESAVDADDAADGDVVSAQIEQPAKVMRIGTMIKQLLEEVRAAPLDEAGRARLREIHESSIRELEDGLAPELREELQRLTIPFGGSTPSEAELRIAQAQLVGWLEGLFHGIQTAIMAQQMQARAQLEEIRRRALPGGNATGDPGQQVIVGPGGQLLVPPGVRLTPGAPDDDSEHRGRGQYL
jgi:hypothetical protein